MVNEARVTLFSAATMIRACCTTPPNVAVIVAGVGIVTGAAAMVNVADVAVWWTFTSEGTEAAATTLLVSTTCVPPLSEEGFASVTFAVAVVPPTMNAGATLNAATSLGGPTERCTSGRGVGWVEGASSRRPCNSPDHFFPALVPIHCPPAEIKVIARRFFPTADHFQLFK